MNLDVSRWDILLGEMFCRPGASLQLPPCPPTGFKWSEWSTPEWSAEHAFQRLGVPLLPFPNDIIRRSMAEGFTTPNGIALNEMTPNKLRCIAHELAHWLLGHLHEPITREEHEARTPYAEFEADTVAMLVCYALGQPEAVIADCRAYVQRYQRTLDHIAGPLPTSWANAKACASRILAAGVGECAREAALAATVAEKRALAERERIAHLDNERRARQLADFASRVKFAPRRSK